MGRQVGCVNSAAKSGPGQSYKVQVKKGKRQFLFFCNFWIERIYLVKCGPKMDKANNKIDYGVRN